MADVFISYHEASAGELAEQIAAALESVGISCWYAKRDIPPGGDFARYIPPQIDACKVFLLILNNGIVHTSKHIENEVGLAFGRLNRGENITILPLEIGDFKQESWIKYYLVHTQSVRIPLLDYTHTLELAGKITRLLSPRMTQATPQQSASVPLTTFSGGYFMSMEDFIKKARNYAPASTQTQTPATSVPSAQTKPPATSVPSAQTKPPATSVPSNQAQTVPPAYSPLLRRHIGKSLEYSVEELFKDFQNS